MARAVDFDEPRSEINKWWYASAAVIVLTLAALAYLLVLPPNQAPQGTNPAPGEAAPAQPNPASPPPTAGNDSRGGGCPQQPASDAIPSTAPATRWEIIDKTALPRTAAGPAVDSPVRRCFARSPEGALLAATNISMSAFGANAEQVFKHQVLPGSNRDAALHEARDAKPRTGDVAQVKGYRFLNYSPDQAQVQLLTGLGERSQAFTITLQWSGDDWKVNLDAPGGYLPPQPASLADGFTAWSGI